MRYIASLPDIPARKVGIKLGTGYIRVLAVIVKKIKP